VSASVLVGLALLCALPREGQAQRGGDDSVLRALAAGTSALANGDTAVAASRFEDAVRSISAIWGDSPEAQKARSLWHEEAVKPFKGHPYERVMAFYYRGILYLMGHDWGNAQASFRNAVQQDGFAEEDQNNFDVAAPLFLQGWALQAQGSLGAAREAYRLVSRLRPDFSPPDLERPQPNVLVVVETGFAPRKVPDGIGSYRLRFFRGRNFSERHVRLGIDGGDPSLLYPIEDVYWQAASRGGRQVDFIFEGKARFAERNEVLGTALTDLAADLSVRRFTYEAQTGRGVGQAADVLGIAGVAALALSSKAKPAVDARYWDNLPDALHLTYLTLPKGRHSLRFVFETADGTPVPELDRSLEVEVGDLMPSLVWLSARDRASAYLTRIGQDKP
jgi:tetratricopeptide (TPR) repeat protein